MKAIMRHQGGKVPLGLLALVGTSIMLVVIHVVTTQAGSPSSLPPGRADPSWETPEPVSGSPQADSEAPSLAVTVSGAVHAVWEEDAQIHHSSRTGSAWSSPNLVLPSPSGERPDLAAQGGGIHLVYAAFFDDNLEIFYRRREGNSWSLPKNVSQTTTGASTAPAVAVAADGTVHVAWAETVGGSSAIYHAQSERGEVWSSSQVPGASGTAPDLAVSQAGELHVMWHGPHLDTGKPQVFYSQRDSGGWSLADIVSDTPDRDSRMSRVAVGADGMPRSVWEEYVGGIAQIHYAVRGSGGWSAAEPVYSSIASSYMPALALDGEASVHVAWDENGSTDQILSRARGEAEAAWSPPGEIVSRATAAKEVVVAVGPDDTLHAAWAEREDEHWDVFYSRGSAGVTPTPTSIATSTPAPTGTTTATATATATPTPTATSVVRNTPTATPPVDLAPWLYLPTILRNP